MNGVYTLYLEGIEPTQSTIRLLVDFDGDAGSATPLVEDAVRVIAARFDVDVDSNNTNGCNDPDRSLNEELIEENLPGKRVAVGADADHDRIPDFVDGLGLAPAHGASGRAGVPVIISVPSWVDYTADTAKLRFTYDASAPTAGSLPGDDFTLAGTEHLRLWTVDGTVVRGTAALPAPGATFVPTGVVLPINAFTPQVDEQGRKFIRLYLDALRQADEDDARRLTVEFDPGCQPAAFTPWQTERVAVSAIRVDLDVDSDNQHGYTPSDDTYVEDMIEDETGSVAGKILPVNDDDTDADSIPDFADFSVVTGENDPQERFIPVTFRLHAPLTENARVRFSYDASDPALVQQQDGVYHLPTGEQAGHLRLWTKDGNAPRSPARVDDDPETPGDYLAPWNPNPYPGAPSYKLASLPIDNGLVTLYLEAVACQSDLAKQRLTIEIDPTGAGAFSQYLPAYPAIPEYADTLRVIALQVDLDIDTDNTGRYSGPDADPNLAEDQREALPTASGKIILTNDDDDDGDGIIDYADGFDWAQKPVENEAFAHNSSDIFVPLRLILPEPIDMTLARLVFTYPYSKPAELNAEGEGDDPADYDYQAPIDDGKTLRIWTRQGYDLRHDAPVGPTNELDEGYLIIPGQLIPVADLGMDDENRTITLYVEGVALPTDPSLLDVITVTLDPDGPDPDTIQVPTEDDDVIIADTVRVTLDQITGGPWTGTGGAARGDLDFAVGDLDVYNPAGPQVSFGRVYSAKMALRGESSPGFTPGWRNTYDYEITDFGTGALAFRYPDGTEDKLYVTPDGVWTEQKNGAPYQVRGIKANNQWTNIEILWSDGDLWKFQKTLHFPDILTLREIKDRLGRYITLSHNVDTRGLEFIFNDEFEPQQLLECHYNVNNGQLDVIIDRQSELDASFVKDFQDQQWLMKWALGTSFRRFTGYEYDDNSHYLVGVNLNAMVMSEVFTYVDILGKPLLETITLVDGEKYTLDFDIDTGKIHTVTDIYGNYDLYKYEFDKQQHVRMLTVCSYAADPEIPMLTYDITYFNSRGSVIKLEDKAGNTASITYATPKNPYHVKKYTDFDGRQANFTYDKFGNVTTAENLHGNGGSTIKTTYLYDYAAFAMGLVKEVQVKAGNNTTLTTTKIDYDGNGLPTAIHSPAPGTQDPDPDNFQTTSVVYDGQGNITSISAPNHIGLTPLTLAMSYANGCRGLVESVGMSSGAVTGPTTTFTYDHDQQGRTQGAVVAVEPPGGGTSYFTRNYSFQPTKIRRSTDVDEQAGQTFTYYPHGGALTVQEEKDNAGTTLTRNENIYGQTGETTEQKLYEGNGQNPVSSMSYQRDPLYRITKMRDQSNRDTDYEYDTTTQFLSKMRYPGKDQERYTGYDALGRLTQKKIFPAPAPGQLEENQTIPDKTLNYSYTGNGQLQSAPGIDNISYDAWDRPETITDDAGTYDIEYSLFGDVLSVTTDYLGAPAQTVEYAYTPAGGRDTLTLPNGDYLAYTYDALGRPDTITLKDDQDTPLRGLAYTYDDDGRVTARTLRDGTDDILRTVYEYDDRGRVAGLTHQRWDDDDWVTITTFSALTYDTRDRIVSFQRTIAGLTGNGHDWSGTLSFAYDARGQLITESFDAADGAPAPDYVRHYTYDAYGNRLTVDDDDQAPALHTWAYTENNQLDDPDYSYDSSGNPTEYAGDDADYTDDNQLTDYGPIDCAYRYDGLRAWKGSGAGASYYLYDGGTLLAEFDAAGTVTTNLWGPDGLAAHGETWYLYDPLGNVVHRLAADGTLLDSEVYDAWGTRLDAVDPDGDPYTPADPYGYKAKFGYYTDRETGLILCGQRYYDPELGRWLTRDPIGIEGGINLYQYCGNDPVNRVDPDGQDWLDNAANFSAGWGDTLSFGITGLVRKGLGVDDVVDTNSGWYWAGIGVGTIHGIAMGKAGGVGSARFVARVQSFIARRLIASGANAFRTINSAYRAMAWTMKPFTRGKYIEKALGQNLIENFPTIDRAINNVITSIKSIDLGCKYAQDMVTLAAKIMKDARELSNFPTTTWAGKTVVVNSMTKRVLQVAIPHAGSSAQQALMLKLINDAAKIGVDLVFTIF